MIKITNLTNSHQSITLNNIHFTVDSDGRVIDCNNWQVLAAEDLITITPAVDGVAFYFNPLYETDRE